MKATFEFVSILQNLPEKGCLNLGDLHRLFKGTTSFNLSKKDF